METSQMDQSSSKIQTSLDPVVSNHVILRRETSPPPMGATAAQPTKANNKELSKSGTAASKRPCKEHSFLTDVADVRTMEQGLLQLLDDFHSGKLQAFGGDCTFDRMDQIREQQERLARLHFELDLQQDMLRLDSEDLRRTAKENLTRLTSQLQALSSSIQSLQKSDVALGGTGERTSRH